jgi:hypothetical protein
MTDIPQFLDRRPLVWTFTMLHTYKDICPYQAAQRFIYKTIPFVKTPAMAFGEEVHSTMEYRVGGGKPLPEKFRHWEPFAAPFDGRGAQVELKLGITETGHATGFFDDDVRGRGKADVVLLHNSTAFMNDWKTGNSKYEDPFELRVHAVLLHAKFPYLTKIKATYTWLKDNRVSVPYDVSDTQSTWNEIQQLVAMITEDKKNGSFEKRKGPLCAHCPCKECEFNKNAQRN